MEEYKNLDCKIIYNKIYDTNKIYTKISKESCITNSCKRRKEEILGNLLNLYKSLEICKR